MPIDATVALSPGWWFSRLLKGLGARRPHLERLTRYVENTAPIPVGSNKAVRESYQRLMAMSSTNYAELICEAVRERMQPVGFKTGAEATATGDKEAWDIWQANALDADSSLVHRDMLELGDAYVIVGAPQADTGKSLITPESPFEVITEEDPLRRRRPLAALKAYHDEVTGLDRAYLYLPGFVIQVARDPQQTFSPRPSDAGRVSYDPDGWEWVGDPLQLPAPVIPVVRFPNRPKLDGCTRGEFETHLSVLDRINYTILERVEVVTVQAYRQRGIKGVPSTDADGNPVDYADIFASDPGALWALPDTAEIWESGLIDLGPILQSIKNDVQDLAAVTRTPMFYLTPDAANGSAEGASLAREGLVFKVGDRNQQAGESWEQVLSLAFTFQGDTERAARPDLEVIWAPPERFTLSERYDAAVKAQAAGVPWREVMLNVLQFSPQEVDAMAAERTNDILLAASLGAQIPPTPAPANGG